MRPQFWRVAAALSTGVALTMALSFFALNARADSPLKWALLGMAILLLISAVAQLLSAIQDDRRNQAPAITHDRGDRGWSA